MLFVLLILVLGFSALTVKDIQNSGAAAGEELAAQIDALDSKVSVAIVTPNSAIGVQLADASEPQLRLKAVPFAERTS